MLGSKPNLGSKPKLGAFTKPSFARPIPTGESNMSLPGSDKSAPKNRYEEITQQEEKPMGFLERARLAKKAEQEKDNDPESFFKEQQRKQTNNDLNSIQLENESQRQKSVERTRDVHQKSNESIKPLHGAQQETINSSINQPAKIDSNAAIPTIPTLDNNRNNSKRRQRAGEEPEKKAESSDPDKVTFGGRRLGGGRAPAKDPFAQFDNVKAPVIQPER